MMWRGDLLADGQVTDLVLECLGQPDAARGVVLEGFPRTLAQALALDGWLEHHAAGVAGAIYLDVPSEELVGVRWSADESQDVWMTGQPPCGAEFPLS
jgi:adenylate kinase